MDTLVLVGNVTCWGAVVVVWTAGAVRQGRSAPAPQARGSTGRLTVLAAFAAVAVILLVAPVFEPLAVDLAWVRMLGAGVLAGSTVFALRARLALGRSWSIGPRAAPERGLVTDGPYAVTRHPIYSGLLGMLLGSALLGGLGQWIALVAAGLVVAAVKIRAEERLLAATYPDDYPAYRARVPMVIPGWRLASPLRPGRR